MQNEKVARLATDKMAQTTRGAAEGLQAAAGAAQESVRGAAEASASVFQAGAEKAQSTMQAGSAQAEKMAGGMIKAAEDAAEFGRGNLEAMTRAAQAYAAGAQDLGRQTFALMQSLGEHAMENARAVAGCRSVKEATELQSSYLRQAMERMMGEGARLQETGYRLAEQTAAPIAQRVTLAMERAGKPLQY